MSASSLQQDVRTISLIGVAHGTSHFFHLLLPPLFPLLILEFGLTYSELGVLVSVFFIVSGVGQALAGFLVDRIGARPVLFAAMACFATAALLAASAQSHAGLMIAAAMAGLGNAPLHPADFTILNKRVSAARLGHGFAVHGISGNLGWAAAPVFLTGMIAITGSWRLASLASAGLALSVLALLWHQREALDDRASGLSGAGGASGGHAPAPSANHAPMAAAAEHPMAFLRLRSVWLCFSFFFWSTCALSAIQSFASPALQTLFGLPLSISAFVVTGYMLCGAAGMLVGGFVVARDATLERTIAICLLASAALLFLVGLGTVTGMVAVVLTVLAGFGAGLAGPSRDMLIKRAAPPGATGRVYGTVYSGLDLGFAVAAPVFGWLLDQGMPSGIFHGAAAALTLGVASAALVAVDIGRRPVPSTAAA